MFLTIQDENNNINNYYLSKDGTNYRISGLIPNKQYKLSINYIARGNSSSVVADSVVALTNTDPTSIRLIEVNGTKLTYKVKIYNEYEFESGMVVLTNCEGPGYLGLNTLNVQNALSSNGDVGEFVLDTNFDSDYICLGLTSVKDVNGNDITINSYHKVKIN